MVILRVVTMHLTHQNDHIISPCYPKAPLNQQHGPRGTPDWLVVFAMSLSCLGDHVDSAEGCDISGTSSMGHVGHQTGLKRWKRFCYNSQMSTGAGPSFGLMMCLSEGVAEITIATAEAAWKRWFSSQRFWRKLAQFESHGWVESTRVGAGDLDGVVRLTAAGRQAAFGGRDPEMCWKRHWDGKWRIVFFDIPVAQNALRKRLGRGLRRLGFGYLQDSVWVSPDPPLRIAEMLRGLKLNAEVLSVMEARPCGGETDADLVVGAWDFERINRNYEVYLDVLGDRPVRSSGRAWRTWLEVEWRAWNRAVGDDPLLPGAVLPARYRGREAWMRRTAVIRKIFDVGSM